MKGGINERMSSSEKINLETHDPCNSHQNQKWYKKGKRENFHKMLPVWQWKTSLSVCTLGLSWCVSLHWIFQPDPLGCYTKTVLCNKWNLMGLIETGPCMLRRRLSFSVMAKHMAQKLTLLPFASIHGRIFPSIIDSIIEESCHPVSPGETIALKVAKELNSNQRWNIWLCQIYSAKLHHNTHGFLFSQKHFLISVWWPVKEFAASLGPRPSPHYAE